MMISHRGTVPVVFSERRAPREQGSYPFHFKRQARELKEVVAKQALELRRLKKLMIADGGDEA
jgi:hypothetical protein